MISKILSMEIFYNKITLAQNLNLLPGVKLLLIILMAKCSWDIP